MAAAPCSVGSRGWPPRAPTPHPRCPLSSPGTLGRRPIKPDCQPLPDPRRPWGIFPQSIHRRTEIRKGGGREELESLGECHSWRRPKPRVLVVVRPCVAAAKPEQPEPGTPTPKPEPSVVKSPPRNRSRACWRLRRAALLPLHQAEPPSLLPLLHRTFFAPSPERQEAGAAAQGRCRCGSRGPRRSASPAPGYSTLLVSPPRRRI
jgi:hypothetical protein